MNPGSQCDVECHIVEVIHLVFLKEQESQYATIGFLHVQPQIAVSKEVIPLKQKQNNTVLFCYKVFVFDYSK